VPAEVAQAAFKSLGWERSAKLRRGTAPPSPGGFSISERTPLTSRQHVELLAAAEGQGVAATLDSERDGLRPRHGLRASPDTGGMGRAAAGIGRRAAHRADRAVLSLLGHGAEEVREAIMAGGAAEDVVAALGLMLTMSRRKRLKASACIREAGRAGCHRRAGPMELRRESML